MSKFKGVLVLVVILILSMVIIGVVMNNINKNRIEIATDLTESISKFFRGEGINKSNYPLTIEASKDLDNFIADIKGRDENYYVILTEEEYKLNIEEQSEVVAPPDIEDFEGLSEEEIVAKIEELEQKVSVESYEEYLKSVLEETKEDKIYVESNELRVKVNDLDFNEEGYATVEMFGGDYRIYFTEIEKTYKMLQNDPDFIFSYLKSERDKSIVKVYFTSVRTKQILRVDVEFKGSNINKVNINLPKI